MAHSYGNDGPGGLTHVVLGVGIIMAIGLFTTFPGAFLDLMGDKKGPSVISTENAKAASCSANTLDTVVGTIGCGGTERAAHLSNVTLVSVSKH